jgi:anti-sigma regulatory factor (Ser/Thr protein kinase)
MRDAGGAVRLLIAIRLAAGEASVPEARRLVSAALRRNTTAQCVIDDMLLATSELMSNAVLHGLGDDVGLALSEGSRTVELSVTSDGPADVGPVHSWSMPPPGSIGGRGLALVRSVADQVDTLTDGDHFTVTVTHARS